MKRSPVDIGSIEQRPGRPAHGRYFGRFPSGQARPPHVLNRNGQARPHDRDIGNEANPMENYRTLKCVRFLIFKGRT